MEENKKPPEDTEVNLDDLYDGKLNHTVIIDPVSKNEVILKEKKPHFSYFALILAIIVLFVFFTYKQIDYIDYINKLKNSIFNKSTTTKATTKAIERSKLICINNSLYSGITINNSIEVDLEEESIITNSQEYSYTLTDQNSILKYNSFITFFDGVYEKLNGIPGLNVEYNKVEKMFTFKIDCFYDIIDFTTLDNLYDNEIEYKTNLVINKNDDINTIKTEYENLNYSCSIN